MSFEAYLPGFYFAGYRSFGSDQALFGPLSKITLLAGQNNAGKSNVLRFVSTFLKTGTSVTAPSGLDMPRGQVSGTFKYAIASRFTNEDLTDFLQQRRQANAVNVEQLLQLFANSAIRLTDDDLAWFRFEASDRGIQYDQEMIREVSQGSEQAYRDLSGVLTSASGSSASNISHILNSFSPIGRDGLPRVETVEAFRRIGTESTGITNGGQLISALQKLERPDVDKIGEQEKFEDINKFLRSVLDDPSARLEIPASAMTINVVRNGNVLPLEHLGTGVHQVIILAAAATLISSSVVCIEEPEVHLHPLLQRKLLSYLSDRTSNQYLIATHSAHLLDSARASVYHIRHLVTGSEVEKAATPQKLADLCFDLGYRPSDLLQANCIIWVEGPSDRLYIRHWLSLLDSRLIEGIHFSIMFYGGRLLSHLSPSDVEVRDFISLRRLNRRLVVVIDSDKKNSRARINETKRRVRDEFDSTANDGYAWITDGYTIENYIPEDLLHASLAELGLSVPWKGEQFKNPLEIGTKAHVDKIKLAHRVCLSWTAEMLRANKGLTRQTLSLVDFIKSSNGL